jgi:hypothetical protein
VVSKAEKRVESGIAPDEAVVERRTEVRNARGSIGRVDHVLVDPETGDITQLVVDRGLVARSVVVPAAGIGEIAQDVVYLDLTKDEVRALPRYRPPAAVTVLTRLEKRLAGVDLDLEDVKTVFEQGLLKLSGVVPDIATKRQAEATARSVRGVVDVENALRTDTAITARVQAALAEDPRTELTEVDVASERGIVTLSGRVDDESVREAVEEVAEEQEGVIDVINDLRVEEDQFTVNLKGWHRRLPSGFRS